VGPKKRLFLDYLVAKENDKTTTKEMLDVEDLAEFYMGSGTLLLPRKRWDIL